MGLTQLTDFNVYNALYLLHTSYVLTSGTARELQTLGDFSKVRSLYIFITSIQLHQIGISLRTISNLRDVLILTVTKPLKNNYD